MQNIDIINVKDDICTINRVSDKQESNSTLLTILKILSDDANHTRIELKIRTSEG